MPQQNTRHIHNHSPRHLVDLFAPNMVSIVDGRETTALYARFIQQSSENTPAALTPHDVPRRAPKQIKALYSLRTQKIYLTPRGVIPCSRVGNRLNWSNAWRIPMRIVTLPPREVCSPQAIPGRLVSGCEFMVHHDPIWRETGGRIGVEGPARLCESPCCPQVSSWHIWERRSTKGEHAREKAGKVFEAVTGKLVFT